MEREEMIRPVVKRITDPLERQKALQVMRQRMSEKYGEELIMSAAAKEELRVQALPLGDFIAGCGNGHWRLSKRTLD